MAQLNFNEQFYLQQNPDVVAAIARGQFANAQAHFNQFGAFEGRDPNAFFDSSFYLSQYPDVLNARANPLDHFINFGAAEFRFSNANADSAIDTDGSNFANEFDSAAYLAANPDLANAVGAGRAFENAYEHYVLFGQFENRPGVQLTNGTPLTGPFATAGNGGGENPGSILTLTTAADTLQGTAGDDVFRALDADTLTSSDVIDGGAGNDVLNIAATAIANNSAAPVIRGVERINNQDAGATLNLSSSSGVQQLWSNGATGTYTYTGVAAGTVIGAAEAGAKTVSVDFTGAVSTVNLAVDDVNGAGVAFTSADAASITSVNLLAAGDTGTSAVADLVNLAGFSAAETVTITGAGDVRVTNIAATAETVTASAATGNVTLDLSGVTALETVSTGSGNDVVTIAAQAEVTINTGAGNDTIVVGGADDVTINAGAGNDIIRLSGSEVGASITGGAGNDLIQIGYAANGTVGDNIANIGGTAGDAATAATLQAGLISITDFNAGQDVVQVNGAGTRVALDNVQLANIAAEGSLFDAVEAAAALTTSSASTVVFNYGNNVYVYSNTDTPADDTFTAGDGLVEIVGTTVAQLTNANFVIAA